MSHAGANEIDVGEEMDLHESNLEAMSLARQDRSAEGEILDRWPDGRSWKRCLPRSVISGVFCTGDLSLSAKMWRVLCFSKALAVACMSCSSGLSGSCRILGIIAASGPRDGRTTRAWKGLAL